MKVCQKIVEVEKEGLEALLGQNVVLFCANYIYTGKLIGVNDSCIKLNEEAAIIYETGPFTNKEWKDCQKLNVPFFYIQTGAIEAFGPSKS